MAQGAVNMVFNAEKGFGFIAQDATARPSLSTTPRSASQGYRSLDRARASEFEIHPGPKGPQAEQVRRSDSRTTSTEASIPIRVGPRSGSRADRPDRSVVPRARQSEPGRCRGAAWWARGASARRGQRSPSREPRAVGPREHELP